MEQTQFAEILRQKIDETDRIAILSHTSPDGDNLGSLHALYGHLKNAGKDVVYLGNDTVPSNLQFLSSVEARVPVDTVDEDFPLLIALDSSDEDRFGKTAKALFLRATYCVNIDHHFSNTQYADLNFVDADATSTGEVLFRILEAMGAEITPSMATGLYTAFSTDTGSFQYDSVTGDTHRMVAKLYDYGCDHYTMVKNFYQSESPNKLSLVTAVLSKIRYYFDGRVAVSDASLEDFERTGAKSDDTEGIVEKIRNVDGVELAVFLKEKEDEIKLSFRSKSETDCTKIAEAFRGGGHIRASGATTHGSLEAVEKKLLEVLDETFGK